MQTTTWVGMAMATLAKHRPDMGSVSHVDSDECVRQVTAFKSVADMMDTAPTYQVKLPISQATSPAHAALMVRVADAFNANARQLGQDRRALLY